MFLEIKGIKKHFGEGDSRIEVLKGIDIEIEKGELCVLLGPSGSGKSYLAGLMHQFAIHNHILAPDAPFHIFNCAQYANNPELLSSNLFGHSKGAFTGAVCDTKGILAASDGGILFLDEVHRLNFENQEKLFIFLDKGIFRKVGENAVWQKANVRIIMATTVKHHFVIQDFFYDLVNRIILVRQIHPLCIMFCDALMIFTSYTDGPVYFCSTDRSMRTDAFQNPLRI